MSDENKTQELPTTLQDLAIYQRKFLHDIASPLMIAMGMTDAAINQLSGEEYEKLKSRLEKSKNSLGRISELLKTNRSILHTISSDK